MFNHTEFVNKRSGVVTSDNALSISGGMNSTWEVDIKELKNILKKG